MENIWTSTERYHYDSLRWGCFITLRLSIGVAGWPGESCPPAFFTSACALEALPTWKLMQHMVQTEFNMTLLHLQTHDLNDIKGSTKMKLGKIKCSFQLLLGYYALVWIIRRCPCMLTCCTQNPTARTVPPKKAIGWDGRKQEISMDRLIWRLGFIMIY